MLDSSEEILSPPPSRSRGKPSVEDLQETVERLQQELQVAKTGWKQAEDERTQTIERYALATEAGNVGVWQFDLSSGVVHVDANLRALIGYDSGEVGSQGRDWQHFVYPDDVERLVESFQNHALGISPNLHIEFRMRHREGSIRWFLLRGKMVRDSTGLPLRILGTGTEITERKLAETSRRESEQRLRAILETTTAMVFIKALDGQYLHINRKGAEVFGFPPSEIIGKSDFDLFTNALAVKLRANDQRIIESGQHYELEETFEFRGEARTYLSQRFIIAQGDGESKVLCGILTDITERKRIDAKNQYRADQLRDHYEMLLSLARHETLFGPDLTAALMVSSEMAAKILRADRVVVWRFSDDGAELQQVDLYDACHGRHTRAKTLPLWTLRDFCTSLAHGELIAAENAVCDPRTHELADSYLLPANILSMLTVPIRIGGQLFGALSIEQGGQRRRWTNEERNFAVALTSLVALSIESDRRKQAERQLSTTLNRLTSHFTNSPLGVIEWDKNLRISRWSRTAEAIFGWSGGDVIGKTLVELSLIDQADVGAMLEVQTRLVSGVEERSTFSCRSVHHSGSILECEWYSSCLADERGELISILSLVLDVTDRKRNEKTLAERSRELSAANAKLERAAHLKDEFLANISHELRTPLNAILGISELMSQGIYGGVAGEQVEALSSIHESGSHLLQLINDILDISKVEAGQLELELAPFSASSVCAAAVRLVKEAAQTKRITVAIHIEPNVDYLVADERRIKQVLVNLLNNAVKFTPEQGRIGVEVSGDLSRRTIDFTVWDTGIGICEEDLSRIFEPFVQVDSRLNRGYAGSGLGLALVWKMIELHGGSTAVDSEIGKGSRFRVSLPWQRISVAEPKASIVDVGSDTTDRGLPEESPTVLLAEDNELNIRAMSTFLHSEGYVVQVARDGVEAVEKAKAFRPQVILMDIQMPKLDGLQAIRRIRECPELELIPIIALTALAMPSDQARCMDAGANHYFSKPVSLRELRGVLTLYTDVAHQDSPKCGAVEPSLSVSFSARKEIGRNES